MDNSSNRKRGRDYDDDSDASGNQPASKLIRVDSSHSVTSSPESDSSAVESHNSDEPTTQTSARVDPVNSGELDVDSVDVELIQEDLLNILEDSDTVADRVPEIQDLDSVIKSFEEEIQLPTFPVPETASGSGGSSGPELGYLLEASDDELGLPPTNGASEEGKTRTEPAYFTADGSEAVGLDGMAGFENDIIPSYDSFDCGLDVDPGWVSNYNGGAEYVALGGLFDYSDGGVSDVPWRSESLSAL